MKQTAINVVWLKRDIRTRDHAPLQAAEESGLPCLILYLFEPELMQHPDAAWRHHQFVFGSIAEIFRLAPGRGEGRKCI